MSENAFQKPAAELNVESASKELGLYDTERKIGQITANPYISKLFTANTEFARENLNATYLEKEATEVMRRIAAKKRENESTFNNGLDTLKSNIEGLSKKRREAMALFTSTLDAELMQREELMQFYDRKNEFDQAFRPEQDAARAKVEQAATIRNAAINNLEAQVKENVGFTPMDQMSMNMNNMNNQPPSQSTTEDFGTSNMFTDNYVYGKKRKSNGKRKAVKPKKSQKKVRFQKSVKKMLKSQFWK